MRLLISSLSVLARIPLFLQERDKIRGVLAESRHGIRFRSEPATLQSVRSRLTLGCQILHFTGYGDKKQLEFENVKLYGTAEYLQVPYFSFMFLVVEHVCCPVYVT